MSPPLRLRLLEPDDEATFLGAHAVMMEEGFTFGLGYDPQASWADYLDLLERVRVSDTIPNGFVRSTFLVADVGGQIVGRSSIRHELNEFLLHEGGHIGYGVLPPFRRQGFATEILRQSLQIARDAGAGDVLVCCDDDNTTSARVIERCGGVLDSVVTSRDGQLVRRYWIS